MDTSALHVDARRPRKSRSYPARAVYDVADLIALTGRSRNWIYAAIAEGVFGQPIRAGRRVLVRRDAVEAWIRGEEPA